METVARQDWAHPVALGLSWQQNQPVALVPQGVVLHHTEPDTTFNNITHDICLARLRHWFIVHCTQRGFSDIGYHLLICAHGVIFEGRHGGITKPVVGAHALANNDRALGVALLGNYDQQLPTIQALKSLQQVLQELQNRFQFSYTQPLPWKRIAADGQQDWVTLPALLGHRDLKPTICPGQALYQWLQGVRARL